MVALNWEHVPNVLITLEGAKDLASLANTLGEALDQAGWKDVLGTIAGDDTILIVAASEPAREQVAQQLREMAGLT